MKAPRFRIAWVMVAVAIAATNFAAIRAFLESVSVLGEVLLFGALPMANVLVVGFLIGLRHPGRRPFVQGFELLGAIALAFYIAPSCFPASHHDIIHNYVSLIIDPVVAIMSRQPNVISRPTIWFVVVVMLGLPQVIFALIGGLLSQKFVFTIRISRRPLT
jgi:hypothetical protein